MKGIDVSSWDGWNGSSFTRYNTESCYYDSDFVIVKTTEGTGYVNPYADPVITRVQNDGKLMGFYHYANGKDATSEADYFYDNCQGYFGHGIPVLDWEAGSNRSWGSTSWAREWCERVHERSGVWPMIYVQASAIWQVANCSDICALWVAGYPDMRNSWNVPNFMYSTSPWDAYTLWQYTSGGSTDRNVANIDAAGWNRIVAGDNNGGVSTAVPQDGTTYPGMWIKNSVGSWWYKHNDGGYSTDNFEQVQGLWYYFDENGYLKAGWIIHDGKYYYMNEAHDGSYGAMKSGWQEINGAQYHFSEEHDGTFGQMTVGWWTNPENGNQYHFHELHDGAFGTMDRSQMISGYYLNEFGYHAIDDFSFVPEKGLIYSGKDGLVVRNAELVVKTDDFGVMKVVEVRR